MEVVGEVSLPCAFSSALRNIMIWRSHPTGLSFAITLVRLAELVLGGNILLSRIKIYVTD
jgi:hypothetical protein